MLVKIFIFLAVALTHSILAAEITSKLQEDEGEMNAVTESTSASSEECGTSTSTTTRNSEVVSNAEETTVTRGPKISVENNEDGLGFGWSEEEHRTNWAKSEPAIITGRLAGEASPMRGNFFAKFDRLRNMDNHDDQNVAFYIIDPHTSPQNQLVDNTLRFMMIKSSVDDLASRVFPNLRILRHAIEDRQ